MSYNPTTLTQEVYDDTKSNKLKEEMENNLKISKKNSEALQNEYDKLQSDKEKKLQEYRDMVLKLNKDKRNKNRANEVDESVITLINFNSFILILIFTIN